MRHVSTLRWAILVVAIAAAGTAARGATVTWNAAADGNWSNAANWDTGVPGSGDDVVFDGTSTFNCTVDVDVPAGTIGNLTLDTGYTGTVTIQADLYCGVCTLNEGTLDINGDGAAPGILHVRGTGDLLVFGTGVLTGTGAGGHTLWYEATGTAPVNVTGGSYNVDVYLRCDFAGVATFDLADNITRMNGFITHVNVAGGSLVFNTNDFSITNAQNWMNISNADGGTLGPTTINFGSSQIEGMQCLAFDNPADQINFQTAAFQFTMWHMKSGSEGCVDVGTSTVTLRRGWWDPSVGRDPPNWPIYQGTALFYDLDIQGGPALMRGSDIDVDNDLTIGTTGGLDTNAAYSPSCSVTVGGNFTIMPTATMTLNTSTLTFDGGGPLQTFTDDTASTWPTIVVADGASVVQGADVTAGTMTIGTGATWDLAGYNLTVSTAFTSTGTVELQGDETVSLPGGLTNVGSWKYKGDGGVGPDTFSMVDVGTASYVDLTFAGESDEVFTIVGDLDLTGNLRLDGPVTVAASGAYTLTVAGTLSTDGTAVTDTAPATIGGADGSTGTLTVYLNGGLDATDVPDYVTFKDLAQESGGSAGLEVLVDTDTTWTGVTFDGMNDTHAAGYFYLNTTGAATLTLTDVTFTDRLSGTDGNGFFDPSADAGTITTESTAASLAVNVTSYLGPIGGDVSEDGAVGSKILWPGSAVPTLTVTATDNIAAEDTPPEDGVFTITRDSFTTVDLLIGISFGGTATPSTDPSPDYSLASTGTLGGGATTVLIPSGSSSITITITPIDDTVMGEGAETVELSLLESGTYDIAAPGMDTVTITDDDSAPEPFNQVKPRRDAGNIPLIPTFEWDNAVGAVSYDIVVGDDDVFTTELMNETVTATPDAIQTYTHGTAVLLGNTTYWWKVTATNVDSETTPASNAPRSFTTAQNATTLDLDGDGIENTEEEAVGADGFITDPLNWDTDGDGCADGWEAYWHGRPGGSESFDPTVSDGGDDPDGDRATNKEEYEDGTNPLVSDLTGLAVGPGCLPAAGVPGAAALAWMLLGIGGLGAFTGRRRRV